MKKINNIEVANPYIFQNCILTDKCFNDFKAWHFENCNNAFEYMNFDKLSNVLQNTIINQFFESIGFHIGRDMVENYWLENSTFFEKLEINTYDYISTIKTLADAIIKANEIYNSVAIDKTYETIKIPIHLQTMVTKPFCKNKV